MGYGGTRRKTVGFAFSASRIAFLLAGYLEKMRAAHLPALRPHGQTNPSLSRVFLFETALGPSSFLDRHLHTVRGAREADDDQCRVVCGQDPPNVTACDSLAYELTEQCQD